jgi:hypothetical protein
MSHSPEPWRHDEHDCGLRDADDNLICGGREYWDRAAPSTDNSERIVAAVNFCRQFDTEFLQSHQMFKVSKGEDGELVAKSLADIPGFYGLVAVAMIPVVREPVSAGR